LASTIAQFAATIFFVRTPNFPPLADGPVFSKPINKELFTNETTPMAWKESRFYASVANLTWVMFLTTDHRQQASAFA